MPVGRRHSAVGGAKFPYPVCGCCSLRVRILEKSVEFQCSCQEYASRCLRCGHCPEHGKCERGCEAKTYTNGA